MVCATQHICGSIGGASEQLTVCGALRCVARRGAGGGGGLDARTALVQRFGPEQCRTEASSRARRATEGAENAAEAMTAVLVESEDSIDGMTLGLLVGSVLAAGAVLLYTLRGGSGGGSGGDGATDAHRHGKVKVN